MTILSELFVGWFVESCWVGAERATDINAIRVAAFKAKL
jgi:hypothetical protein